MPPTPNKLNSIKHSLSETLGLGSAFFSASALPGYDCGLALITGRKTRHIAQSHPDEAEKSPEVAGVNLTRKAV